MKRTAADLMTVDDYRAMLEGPPYHQLIEGELIRTPAPNLRHQRIARNIFRLLDAFLCGGERGEVYFAPVDVFLSEHHVVQPDVLFIAEAHRDRLRTDGVHGAPDLVVEILSPSSGKLEKARKLPLYARHGVKEEWLIDPNLEQVHRYELAVNASKAVQILEGEERFSMPLFLGLEIRVAEIFRD